MFRMKKLKFFGSLFAALYCVFFGILVAVTVTEVPEKWYLFGISLIAAGFYFGFTWSNRPSQWWLC